MGSVRDNSGLRSSWIDLARLEAGLELRRVRRNNAQKHGKPQPVVEPKSPEAIVPLALSDQPDMPQSLTERQANGY